MPRRLVSDSYRGWYGWEGHSSYALRMSTQSVWDCRHKLDLEKFRHQLRMENLQHLHDQDERRASKDFITLQDEYHRIRAEKTVLQHHAFKHYDPTLRPPRSTDGEQRRARPLTDSVTARAAAGPLAVFRRGQQPSRRQSVPTVSGEVLASTDQRQFSKVAKTTQPERRKRRRSMRSKDGFFLTDSDLMTSTVIEEEGQEEGQDDVFYDDEEGHEEPDPDRVAGGVTSVRLQDGGTGQEGDREGHNPQDHSFHGIDFLLGPDTLPLTARHRRNTRAVSPLTSQLTGSRVPAGSPKVSASEAQNKSSLSTAPKDPAHVTAGGFSDVAASPEETTQPLKLASQSKLPSVNSANTNSLPESPSAIAATSGQAQSGPAKDHPARTVSYNSEVSNKHGTPSKPEHTTVTQTSTANSSTGDLNHTTQDQPTDPSTQASEPSGQSGDSATPLPTPRLSLVASSQPAQPHKAVGWPANRTTSTADGSEEPPKPSLLSRFKQAAETVVEEQRQQLDSDCSTFAALLLNRPQKKQRRLRQLEKPSRLQEQERESLWRDLLLNVQNAIRWKTKALRESQGIMSTRNMRRMVKEQQGKRERRHVFPGQCKTTYAMKKFLSREVEDLVDAWRPENVRKSRNLRLMERASMPEIVDRVRSTTAILREFKKYQTDKEKLPS